MLKSFDRSGVVNGGLPFELGGPGSIGTREIDRKFDQLQLIEPRQSFHRLVTLVGRVLLLMPVVDAASY